MSLNVSIRWFWLILICLVISGCFPTHAQRKYLASIYGRSNIIHVPAAKADSAWLRAKYFVQTYATDTIEEMSDSLVRTKLPSIIERFLRGGYGYWVYRTWNDKESVISAYVIPGHSFIPFVYPDHNDEIFIDYISSGRLPFPELILQ